MGGNAVCLTRDQIIRSAPPDTGDTADVQAVQRIHQRRDSYRGKARIELKRGDVFEPVQEWLRTVDESLH